MNSEKSQDSGSNTKVTDIAPKSRGVCFIRTWTRRIILGAGLISIATAAFILSPLQNIVYASMDAQDDLTRADYIICLGGDPGRVLEATRLLSDDYAPILIVTNHGSAAEQMRRIAIDWGASPSRVLMDDSSRRTADHPVAVARVGDIDIENDTCIIVTSYTHLARSRAIFEAAGFRHLIMREPRWEREVRPPEGLGWRGRFMVFPSLAYEASAWVKNWLQGNF